MSFRLRKEDEGRSQGILFKLRGETMSSFLGVNSWLIAWVLRPWSGFRARWCPAAGAASSSCGSCEVCLRSATASSSLSSWRGSTGQVDPARARCAHARGWGQGLSFGFNSCTCLGIASLQLNLTLLSLQPGAVALLDSSTLRYGRELLGLLLF